MKVCELIELLQTMPPEHEVIYRCYSDYSVLNANDITVQTQADMDKPCPYLIRHHNMVGQFMNYYPSQWPKSVNENPPAPAEVVILPGN